MCSTESVKLSEDFSQFQSSDGRKSGRSVGLELLIDQVLFRMCRLPISHSVIQPLSQSTNQPPNHPATQLLNHSVTQLLSHSATQPINHQTNQPPSHPATQSLSPPAASLRQKCLLCQSLAAPPRAAVPGLRTQLQPLETLLEPNRRQRRQSAKTCKQARTVRE